MNDVQNFEKKEFIISECMLSSVQTGLQTRNKNYPIYNKLPLTDSIKKELKSQPDNTSNLKWFIFDFLTLYLKEIKENGMIESVHLLKIRELAENITKEFKPVLYEGRFRIGISQKIINLFLKYMWSMDEIPEPCHCPMDGIVKSQIQENLGKTALVDWTQLDNMIDYLDYVKAVKQIAIEKNMSIAEWEFLNWGRR
jgi:hypothetical protein